MVNDSKTSRKKTVPQGENSTDEMGLPPAPPPKKKTPADVIAEKDAARAAAKATKPKTAKQIEADKRKAEREATNKANREKVAADKKAKADQRAADKKAKAEKVEADKKAKADQREADKKAKAETIATAIAKQKTDAAEHEAEKAAIDRELQEAGDRCKTLLAEADQALSDAEGLTKEADEKNIAVGKELLRIKSDARYKGIKFEILCDKYFGIKKSRGYQLVGMANGETTGERERAKNAKANSDLRKRQKEEKEERERVEAERAKEALEFGNGRINATIPSRDGMDDNTDTTPAKPRRARPADIDEDGERDDGDIFGDRDLRADPNPSERFHTAVATLQALATKYTKSVNTLVDPAISSGEALRSVLTLLTMVEKATRMVERAEAPERVTA